MTRSIVSEIVLAGLAMLILVLRHRSLLDPFRASRSAASIQLACGAIAGLITALPAAALLLRHRWFADSRRRIADILRSSTLGPLDVTAVALAAGIGEEYLFRGALQPWIGLAGSTAAFTLVHLWMPVAGAARVVYFAFVIAASLVLGTLFDRSGLLAAITAHAVMDLAILLLALRARIARLA